MTTSPEAPSDVDAGLSFERSRELYERARTSTPGGVHTNIRLAEKPWPLFFEGGRGGHLTDVDGNDLIDLVCGNGPLILGHSPAAVVEAVHRAIDRGLVYAGQSTAEVEAAELIRAHVPSAERVRLSMTGTEAMQAAIRIARAATGRQKLLLFQGHYDGWADSVLWNVGSSSRARGDGDLIEPLAESMGVEARLADDLLIAQWNDADAVRRILSAEGADIAAVVMEPVMGNSGVIEPVPGYLEAVREATREAGSVLIFDEVITGFRVAPGGAQARYGVTPDLSVFGKAIAAGFPVACIAGRADLMEGVGTGKVMHAGTFNSNPVASAAVVAAMGILTDPASGVYERLEARGSQLMEGLRSVIRELDLPVLVQGLPMLMNVSVTRAERLVDHRDVAATDRDAIGRLQLELVRRGVRLQPRGTIFLSAAHTEDDVERVVQAFAAAAPVALADGAGAVRATA